MKIKNKCLLLLLLTSTLTIAQSNNIIDSTQYVAAYKYTYLKDSTNSNSFKTDFMTLYIGNLYTKFEHEGRYYSDSLLRVFNISGAPKSMESDITTKGMKVRSGTHFTKYSLIKKLFSDTTILFENPIKSSKIKVTEVEKINWKLNNAKEEEISHYHCKKATATFKGRNYTAWYTLDIPISEGPYKFRGLPGLIVKIEDSQAQHSFVLDSSKESKKHRPIYFNKDDYEEVSMEDYYRAKKAEISSIIQMLSNGTVKLNGSISTGELEARFLRQNNYIERL